MGLFFEILEVLGGLIPCQFSKPCFVFSLIEKSFKILPLYFLYFLFTLYMWLLHKLLCCGRMTFLWLWQLYTDIKECQYPQSYPCPSGSKCIDTDGGYKCQCNLFRRGEECRPIIPMTVVALLGEHKSQHKLIRFFCNSMFITHCLFLLFFTLSMWCYISIDERNEWN